MAYFSCKKTYFIVSHIVKKVVASIISMQLYFKLISAKNSTFASLGFDWQTHLLSSFSSK